MDGNKITVLAVAALLVASTGASIIYKVDVDESLNHSTFQHEYQQEIDSLQAYSAVIDNTGSVGCTYRLVNELRSANYSRTDYSGAHELWPGESDKLTVYSVPLNITGQIESTLKVEYCGKTSEINQTTFNIRENTSANRKIHSTTLESGDDFVKFKTNITEALAVPIHEPPYWKVESKNITSGKANVDFQAPIFSEDKSIVFALVNKTSEKVIGRTEVSMSVEETLLDRLDHRVINSLFAVSLLLNALLVALIYRQYRK